MELESDSYAQPAARQHIFAALEEPMYQVRHLLSAHTPGLAWTNILVRDQLPQFFLETLAGLSNSTSS